MPEGVEVCISAQYLHRKLKTKKLIAMNLLGGKFKRNGIEGSDLIVPGYRFKKVDSKGKLLWFELTKVNPTEEESLYLMSGFGMVGYWGFHQQKHSHVEFVVEDGQKKQYSLYFTDHRNFGNLKITNQVQVFQEKLDSLGPDLLKESFDEEQFQQRVQFLLNKNRNYKKKKRL